MLIHSSALRHVRAPRLRLHIETLEDRRLLTVTASDFQSVRDCIGDDFTGATVITHGLLPVADRDGDALYSLAESIFSHTGGWLVDYDISEEAELGQFELTRYDAPGASPNANNEIVLLFDWSVEAHKNSSGWGEAAGDALFSILTGIGLVDPELGPDNTVPLHLIGHSFGAAVVSETAERLTRFDVPVDHVTYLDPHDFDQDTLELDEDQRLYELGQPQDYGVTVWDGVAFTDAYYQTRGADDGATSTNAAVALGRPIPGAYNRWLNDGAELPARAGDPYSGDANDHSYVWSGFYEATVLGDLPTGQPEPEEPITYSVTGYAFSRVAGGQQLRPDPTLHGDQDHTYSSPEVADPNQPFTDFVAAPTWNPANPANGNLDHAGDYATPLTNPQGSLAGWTHHGGGGPGRVDFNGSGESYLELDSEHASRTHNWSYVPAYATALEFSFQVSRQNFNNVLRVRVGDEPNAFRDFALHPANVPASISVTRFESFERQYVCLPEPLRGNVETFDFEIVAANAGAAVDAEVRVDDVRYSNTSCEGPSVVEVIDTSGSMQGEKLLAAQESASLFVDLMGDGDRIGVVSYADDAAVQFPLTEITDGSNVRQAAKDEIDRLISEGATSIGAGIREADGELDSLTPEENIRAMVVLTDGNHNTDPDPFDVIDSDVDDDIRIFTIGFGADADEELMREIADLTGGQYYFAPDEATLQQVYVELSGTVTGQLPIFQQSSSIQIGQTITSNIRVDSSVADFTFGVTFPQGDLDLEVITPTGTVITPSLAASDPNVNHIEGPTYEFVQVNRPPVGVWKLHLTGVDVAPGGVEYDLFARVDSTIRSKIVDIESAPTLGDVTNLQVAVDDGLPLLGANVIAHVTNIGIENGVTRSTVLYDDGMHDDGKAGDGVYGTTILLGDVPGRYEVQAHVSGTTSDGETFERFPSEIYELHPASSATLPRVLFQSPEGAKVIENDTEVDSQLQVSDTFRIADIDIQLDLEYTISADLDIDLIAPDGRRIELVRSDLAERVTAYTQTIFDDDAPTSILDGTQPFTGRFQPVGDLSELHGFPANGTWGLDVTDDIDNGIGTLKSWNITIVGQPLSVTPLTFIDNGQPMPAGATLDFGVAYEGTLAPTRSLAVLNNGTEPLALSGLGLPAGFELVGAPFGELPPGSTASFAVRLETSMVTHTEGSSELIVGEVPNYPVPFTLNLMGSVAPRDSSLWNNFVGTTDVDNDGVTTARDALLIINDLASLGGRDLPSAPPAFTTPFFIDVTNDFRVTPQDVLQVINEINAPTGNSPQGIPLAATISQEILGTQRQSSDTRLEVDDTARQMSTDLLMANVAVYATSVNGDYRSTDQRSSLPANDKAAELDAALDALDGWLLSIG